MGQSPLSYPDGGSGGAIAFSLVATATWTPEEGASRDVRKTPAFLFSAPGRPLSTAAGEVRASVEEAARANEPDTPNAGPTVTPPLLQAWRDPRAAPPSLLHMTDPISARAPAFDTAGFPWSASSYAETSRWFPTFASPFTAAHRSNLPTVSLLPAGLLSLQDSAGSTGITVP